MNITAVRQAISNQITAVVPAPLTSVWYVPDMPTEPMVWLRPTKVTYDKAYGPHGFEQIDFSITLVVSRADDQADQLLLDQYIHGTGPLSVKAAIESGRAQYGGTAYTGVFDDCWVSDVNAYQYYSVGGQTFLGADWTLMVVGSGTI